MFQLLWTQSMIRRLIDATDSGTKQNSQLTERLINPESITTGPVQLG